MELVLVRHGLPERSDATADPPLCAEGHEQAARVARWLAQEAFDVVYSSPMHRAVQTAQPFASAGGHELRTHPGIVEFDRNAGVYIPMEDLKREDYPRWKAMVDGGFDTDIVGFQAMVVAALEEIIEAHASQRVAVFCHGGVINVWTAHVLGMAPRLFFEPGYTSVHRYLCARSGQRNVVALNERFHLTDHWPVSA
jgi:probable phosphoglycerate mutase